MKRMSVGQLVLLAVFVFICVAAVIWAISVWNVTSGIEMSKHGWIALGLGTFFACDDRTVVGVIRQAPLEADTGSPVDRAGLNPAQHGYFAADAACICRGDCATFDRVKPKRGEMGGAENPTYNA